METKLPALPDTPEFQQGRIGESQIGRWLNARGNCVLPVYEIEIPHGKGPRFHTPAGTFIAPDFFIIPSMTWVEAKHKTAFTWHRLTERWTTGIDLRHYENYKRTQEESGRRVWLLFLHRCSTPDAPDIEAGCPPACLTGLFGGGLDYLSENENHRHENWGRHGMVYWAEPDLTKFAELSEIDESCPNRSAAL